ncbi:hypothetical protein [Rhizobium sp.]|uniref:hypothetical protein n=1 Tax=Rhizobium sp. TaxID=391 RepID=UPI00389A8FA6
MPNRKITASTPSRGLHPPRRDPFMSFRREINRLFPTVDAATANTAGSLWPSFELHETDQAYDITAELPGLEEKDIVVNLRDNAVSNQILKNLMRLQA